MEAGLGVGNADVLPVLGRCYVEARAVIADADDDPSLRTLLLSIALRGLDCKRGGSGAEFVGFCRRTFEKTCVTMLCI